MTTDGYRARIWRRTLSRYVQWPSFGCEGQYGKMDGNACLHTGEATEIKVSWMWVGAGILTITPWEIIGRDKLWWFCGENKMTLERFLEEMMKHESRIGKIFWATDYHWDCVSFIGGKNKIKKERGCKTMRKQKDFSHTDRLEKPWLGEYPSDAVSEIYI